MTAGRFCPQCGRDAAGAAFCPYCGASQAVEPAATPQPPQPGASFCPSCGARVAPGLAFCTRCGASLATGVPLAPSQYVGTAGKKSGLNSGMIIGAGAFIVVLVVGFVVLSGGDDEKSTSTASSGQAPDVPSAATKTAPPRGPTVEPTLDPAPGPPIPPASAPGASLGSSDSRAADEVEQSLKAAGFNLTGLRVAVFLMRETGGEHMLVLDINAKAATSLTNAVSNTADQKKLLTALTSPPLLKQRKVTRVMININDTDPKEGPYTVIMSMTFATAEGIARGSLTEAQMQQQVQIRTRKG
jgi:hypothetical protein